MRPNLPRVPRSRSNSASKRRPQKINCSAWSRMVFVAIPRENRSDRIERNHSLNDPKAKKKRIIPGGGYFFFALSHAE